ncbi:LLM class flavin-dependent oxidoreductase [Streptomyces sp. NPDC047017]|uniref:LLM class flavin-dependent oxidoreductase n=1 Tax=Streptomyces sp. NPDC047017 TaxID=3155024 RepID=UPI0033D665F8
MKLRWRWVVPARSARSSRLRRRRVRRSRSARGKSTGLLYRRRRPPGHSPRGIEAALIGGGHHGMDIGVLLPTGAAQWDPADDPRELVALGRHAERSGLSSLFVNDSLIGPRVEALTMLAALAPATGSVRLGTAALLPLLRRPVQAAQSPASIDLLSGGRLTVAVGAGFPGRFGQPLHRLSEVPWERRFARLDETVALWRALWRGADSFHGEILRFDHIPPTTRPARTGGPPVWLGGATPAALVRTGRLYDGRLPYPPDPADYACGLRRGPRGGGRRRTRGRRRHARAVRLGTRRRRPGERTARTRRVRARHVRHAAGGAGEGAGRRRRSRGPSARTAGAVRGRRCPALRRPARGRGPALPARPAGTGRGTDPRPHCRRPRVHAQLKPLAQTWSFSRFHTGSPSQGDSGRKVTEYDHQEADPERSGPRGPRRRRSQDR